MGFRGTWKNKRDANEPAIVAEFQARGVSVERVDKPLDLICGYRGRTYLVEVKMPDKDLNKNQREFVDGWRGQVAVVWCVEDAADLVAEWAREAQPSNTWRGVSEIADDLIEKHALKLNATASREA